MRVPVPHEIVDERLTELLGSHGRPPSFAVEVMLSLSKRERRTAVTSAGRGRDAERSEEAGVTTVPATAPRIPAWCLIAILAYAPVILFVDGRLTAPWPWEYVLGVMTLAVLAWWTSRLTPSDRLQVWVCVVVATAWEYVGSQVWGGYRYRFGGIPAYVPFGHGLVYVFAFTLAAQPFVARRERAVAFAALALAWGWAIAGVTVLPAITHRVDWHGWYWLPLFTAAIVLGPRKALFAGIFIAVTDLEVAGTAFGAWTWVPHAPWMHVTSGNPPSAVAGGYAVIDGSVMLTVALLAFAGRRLAAGATRVSRISSTLAGLGCARSASAPSRTTPASVSSGHASRNATSSAAQTCASSALSSSAAL